MSYCWLSIARSIGESIIVLDNSTGRVHAFPRPDGDDLDAAVEEMIEARGIRVQDCNWMVFDGSITFD